MKLNDKKLFFLKEKSLFVILLLGTMVFAGCEKKKKETPLWMLGLLGSGGSSQFVIVKTGQTTEYQSGDNGTYQTGTERSYSDSGSGTITDNATGLVWQKCFKGRNNDGTCTDDAGVADTSTWADAGTYCSSLSLAGRSWRLPTRQELETLPDYGSSSPSLDTLFFPATGGNSYWSSTEYAANTNNVWVVSFLYGNTNNVAKTDSNNYVRCISQ